MLIHMNSWTTESPIRGGASRKWREVAGRAGSFTFSAPRTIFLSS